MSYTDLLQQYGRPSESAEHRVYIYVRDPAKMSKAADVTYRDKAAAQQIAELERYIADLKDYRLALAARYAELDTMPYTLRLDLERYPAWNGRGVRFEIRIMKRYQDGTTVSELDEQYSGKLRRQALARFEELKKQRPGIETWIDIERRSWER